MSYHDRHRVVLNVCAFIISLYIGSCTKGGNMSQADVNFQNIAALEAQKSGFDTSATKVVIDTDRSHVAVSRLMQMIDNDKEVSDKLQGGNFVVVFYSPIQEPGRFVLGGEFYVFIDSKTEKVLHSVKLK